MLTFSLLFAFSLTVTSTAEEVADDPVVTTSVSDFWINDWNDKTRPRSILAYNRGLDTDNSNYGNFSVYKEIEVITPDVYYLNPTAAGFGLKEVTDLTPYEETGTLRFWINVPKSMSVKVTLKSYVSGKYSEASVSVALDASAAVDGYQEVEIPLKNFFAANKNWNAAYTKFVLLGGVSGCDKVSFLDVGEKLCVSPFEIWPAESPEPVTHDATPVFRDLNSKAFIRDSEGVLDKTAIVKCFNNTLEKGSYDEAVKSFGECAELLSLYSVDIVNVLSDSCAKTGITGQVELYIPVTGLMEENHITVAVCKDGEFVECESVLTDEYLVITTDTLGSIFVIDTNAPLFVADTSASGNDKKVVDDNTCFDEAVFFKNEVKTSANSVIFNEGSLAATDITDWLKNEEAFVRFYVKTPKRQGTPEISLKIGLCMRYYVGTSGKYPQTVVTLPLPADGRWHEVRLSSTAFSDTAFDAIINSEEYTESFDMFYIRVAAGNEQSVIKAAEGLYFTPFEFYKKELLTPADDGNIEKKYEHLLTLEANPSWKTDSKKYVSRTVTASDEIPFISSKVTFTACDTYTAENASEISSTQLGVAYQNGILCEDFAQWAYYNRHAEMRFWVKTENDVSFKIGVLAITSTGNAEITATVTCKGSKDWQEIRIKRSDMYYSTNLDGKVLENETCNLYLNFYVTSGTFTAGKSIELSRRVEFFNDFAYSKGDANLDGDTNIMDLIRVKKLIAGGASEFINGDIDLNGTLTATDTAYIRKWLLSGAWK